jgi:hypothetical protein
VSSLHRSFSSTVVETPIDAVVPLVDPLTVFQQLNRARCRERQPQPSLANSQLRGQATLVPRSGPPPPLTQQLAVSGDADTRLRFLLAREPR